MVHLHLRKGHLSKNLSAPSTPTRSDSNTFPSSPQSASPSKQNTRPILHGAILSQRNLPTPVSQFGFLERPSTPTLGTENKTAGSSTQVPQTPHVRKWFAQQLRWENEVLPILVRPYMEYLQKSLNLPQDIELQHNGNCTCMTARERVLEVVVLQFGKLQKIFLRVCQYRPAAVQLIKRRLFGNAPKEPTLTVGIWPHSVTLIQQGDPTTKCEI
ncbi:hypothetical protein BDP27DRAFT_1366315 [Rhodocollybia butyracea]|uniref:Uncharacterized protein n=1 Tax=Rhodocollybia butyracea TaxID=206335 RepID=A0A9P5PLE3_9AGAR|nr:hypothetical protein BDP27DRAFT_1366315 [Rhodocollybia butyracea]